MNILLISLALIATMLVCAWFVIVPRTANRKHNVRNRVPASIAGFMLGIQEALVLPTALWRRYKYRHFQTRYAVNVGEGTHQISKTYKTDAAVATRYLLGKIGSDQDHVAACGAGNIPVCVITDEASAAEDLVAGELLGISSRTLPMVASEAIAAGVHVYTAANGKVQDLPAGAGTYYEVGVALTAAAADGDRIEVLHCVPRKTVVT